MHRGARFFPVRALPCSVALVLQLLMFLSVPHVGLSEGVRNVVKSVFFFIVFRMKGALGAATKWIPNSKTCKICPDNECFVRLLWELFGVHLGWSLFVRAHRGCSNATLKSPKKCLKIMVWEIFGGPVWGDPFGLSSQRKRSHAAWRSFFVSPDCSHALWRPFSVSPGRSHAAWRPFFAMSPSTFRYVTSVFVLFYKDFVMLSSHFQGKPKDFRMLSPFLFCLIRIWLCYLHISKDKHRISICYLRFGGKRDMCSKKKIAI